MFIAKLVFEACLLEPCLYEPPIRHVSLCSEKHVITCFNFSGVEAVDVGRCFEQWILPLSLWKGTIPKQIDRSSYM
jgi:hypothetical protein